MNHHPTATTFSDAQTPTQIDGRVHKPAPDFTIVPAVPDSAPDPASIRHPTLGAPNNQWIYTDALGRPLTIICRFDTEGEDGTRTKEIRPYSHGRIGTQKAQWF